MKCPNCNAEVKSSEIDCSYCKSEVNPPKKRSSNLYEDIFGQMDDDAMAQLNQDMDKVVQAAMGAGKANPQMYANAIPNPYFLNNFAKEHAEWNAKTDEEKHAIREKNRLARIALANHKCPECTNAFPPQDLYLYCKKCGTMLSEINYMDKF